VTAAKQKEKYMYGYHAMPHRRRERRDINRNELTVRRHAHRYQVPWSRAPEPSSAAHAHTQLCMSNGHIEIIIGVQLTLLGVRIIVTNSNG
jgi:hypothetical protein